MTQWLQAPGGKLPGLSSEGVAGVSLVTCCMNREENILRGLRSWLVCQDIAEIIIVDWSSDRPVQEALAEAGISDPRIRIVRVEAEARWILTYAFNAGFRAASRERILKVDADIILAADFFARNRLDSGHFIAGNWRLATQDQAHVNGFLPVQKGSGGDFRL